MRRLGVWVTIEIRSIIQAGTLFLSVMAMVQFIVLVRLGVLPWRLVIVPFIVISEIAVFYSVLVVFGPLFDFSIGPIANYISAMIRFQSVAVLTTYLSFTLYTKVRAKRG